MRVGGPTREFAEPARTGDVLDLVRRADADKVPLLVMGGGSNLVVGDDGWDGLTVRVATSGIEIDGPIVRADAGVDWDTLVATTLEQGLAGFEALSGIPGTVGATPVQNVGAYGTQTSDLLESVTVYDRRTDAVSEWSNEQCGFGTHRQSAFKHTDRYLVLGVTYRLRSSTRSGPIGFTRLADRLEIDLGATASTSDVRRAVLELRGASGMVLDDTDHDTWSVGSFFLGPVLASVPPEAAECPAFPDPLGTKLAAGWLVDHAGFPRGYGRDWGRGAVTLSTKHALAITNRGDATTREVMQFAAHIRAGVFDHFGILLTPECHLVGCSLDD
jgi:UDP-N-acetylmuramate dehydrogenase